MFSINKNNSMQTAHYDEYKNIQNTRKEKYRELVANFCC